MSETTPTKARKPRKRREWLLPKAWAARRGVHVSAVYRAKELGLLTVRSISKTGASIRAPYEVLWIDPPTS